MRSGRSFVDVEQRPTGRRWIVLGIDPGLTRCGLAVLAGGPSPSLVYASAIRTDSGAPLAERLLAIDEGLREAIEAHRPTVVATEQVLFNANARTAMATAQAAGVAMAAAARCGLAVHRYSPTAVKLAVAGHGGASKDAVSRMVVAQLGLSTPPRPADAADAAAVALCHLASLDAPAAAGPATWDDLVEARGLPVKGGTGTGS